MTPFDFNSYGARRGHHEVMMRGTFGNIRLRNALATKEGPYTTFQPDGEEMFLYDASMRYQAEGVPLVILAGQEYGSGISRDWAAKGTRLLGVRAVIAQSYERIHRSNLVGMGVLPLQFLPGESASVAGPDRPGGAGHRRASPTASRPRRTLRGHGDVAGRLRAHVRGVCRLDGPIEVDYYRQGGILPAVLRRLADA